MKKVGNKIAIMLGRLGNSIFRFLSSWEEFHGLARLSRWLKLSVLGGVVFLMGAVSLEEPEEHIMCYDPVIVPDAYVSEISVTPNPTDGADSVNVAARASLSDSNSLEIIERVFCHLAYDTNRVLMTAVDGKLNSGDENVAGRISVEGIEPGTTWMYVTAYTSNEGSGYQWTPLYVTDEDSIDISPQSDSTHDETK